MFTVKLQKITAYYFHSEIKFPNAKCYFPSGLENVYQYVSNIWLFPTA